MPVERFHVCIVCVVCTRLKQEALIEQPIIKDFAQPGFDNDGGNADNHLKVKTWSRPPESILIYLGTVFQI